MDETVDDPSAWGAVPDDNGPASWGATSSDEGPAAWGAVPADEPSAIGSFAREGAHSLGAGIGAGLGMVGGAALGSLAAPGPGTIAGGIAGGVGGGMAGQAAEDWLLDKLGLKQGTGQLSDVQRQQDIATNPNASFAGGLAGAVLPSFGVGAGPMLAARGAGAAIQGGIEAGQELYNNQNLDPSKIAIAGGVGAAFPQAKGWVRNLEGRLVPRNAPSAPVETPAERPPDAKPTEAPVVTRDMKPEAEDFTDVVPTNPTNEAPPIPQADAGTVAETTKAKVQPGGQASKSPPFNTSNMKGTASEQPKVIDPNVGTPPEAPGGAAMKERIAARPSDPRRNLAKDAAAPPPVEGAQPSTVISVDPIHPDIAAARAAGEPTQPPGEAQPMPQREPPPAPEPAPQAAPVASVAPQKPPLVAPPSVKYAPGEPRPSSVLTGIRLAQAVKNPANINEIVNAAIQHAPNRPIVETPMPSGANSSKDLINGPVYVDPSVPPELRPFVAVHETAEAAARALGMPYEQAHPIGEAAERRAVEAAGIPWERYQAAWREPLRIAASHPHDIQLPTDLATDPWAAIGHYHVPSPVEGEGVAQPPTTAPKAAPEEGIPAFLKRNPDGSLANPQQPAAQGKWDAATKALKDFIGEESGGLKIPKWWVPDPEDPTNPSRSDQVKAQLAKTSKLLQAYADLRAKFKLGLRGNEIAAHTDNLTPEEWKQGELAYTNKTEKTLPAKIYDAMEARVKPLLDLRDRTYQEIYDLNKKLGLGLSLADPNIESQNRNIPRMRVGEDEAVKGEGYNVVSGNKLSISAPSIRNREFMRLVSDDGKELILHQDTDGTFTLHQKGKMWKLTNIPDEFKGRVGDEIPLYRNGEKTNFKVDEASTDDIEKATGGKVQYLHNPVITASNSLNQMHNVLSNIKLIRDITSDPWWKENTTTHWDDYKVDGKTVPGAKTLGYDKIPTKLEAVGKQGEKIVYMPKNMRWLLDDMHKQGFGGDDSDFLSKAGSIMARSFLVTGSPIHMGNMATNAVIARGFDNIAPKGVKDLGVYGARAVKALMDPANSTDYNKALDAGVQLQFHNTMTNDLIPGMMKRFGVDVAKQPSKWDPIAKIFGISTPDLARAVEHASTGEMWRIGDMFPIQRFLELTEGKGMSPGDAAAEVNKFSSYKTGPTFGGSGNLGRFIQQVMVDPRTSLFGRWHMLLMRSMAHVARNVLARDSTKEQRIQGVGQIMAAAALAYIAYPAADAAIQAISGNPDADVGRRGMLAVTDGVKKVLAGDRDYATALSPVATPAIPLNMAMKGLGNVTYNRKKIVEQMPFNSVKNVARAGSELADWTAGNVVPTYGTISDNLEKGSSPMGAAGKFLAGTVGARIPSDAARVAKAREQKYNNQAIKSREKHPGGMLESLVNRIP